MLIKKSKVELILLLISILFILSCEYEPTGVYNRLVNKNVTPPQIQTIELNLNEDTIFLYGDQLINFKFESSNQKIKVIRYLIDGVVNGYVYSDSGVFNINYNYITPGIHSMTLEVFTGSGTGSIADHIGAEGYLFSKSWVLVIIKSHNIIANNTITNGLLKLNWSKYLASDFKEYIVYKSSKFIGIRREAIRLKTPEFIDSSYIGEVCTYTIDVITLSGKILAWSSLELKSDLPAISFKATDQNEYYIRWGKTKYYNAVDTFVLFQTVKSGVPYIWINSTQDPNDTVYQDVQAKFGDQAYLKLRLVPKKNNVLFTFPYSGFEIQFTTDIGYPLLNKIQGIRDIHQVSKDEFICVWGSDSLMKYSVSKKQLIQKIGYPSVSCPLSDFRNLSVSPAGKYITSYVNCNDDVILNNSANLQLYSLRNLTSMSGTSVNPAIPVSDNGICIIDNNWDCLYLYDLINSNTIAKYSKNCNGLKISQKGDYFFASDDSFRLMLYKNLQFSTIWKQSNSAPVKFFEFDGSDSSRFVFWTGTTFSIKLCSDYSSVYEYPLSDKLICNIDYYNHEMLTYNDGHLYVRNYIDGSILHDIPINFSPSDYYRHCFLINHTIVSESGAIYYIN